MSISANHWFVTSNVVSATAWLSSPVSGGPPLWHATGVMRSPARATKPERCLRNPVEPYADLGIGHLAVKAQRPIDPASLLKMSCRKSRDQRQPPVAQ